VNESASTAPLGGRVALVTGSSRGLGREIALGLAKAGADIVITSRKFENCQSVCREVEALGRRALPYACHVGHWDELPGLVDAAYSRFGRVDILVNNAGSSPMFESLADVSEKLWDSTFAVNLKGPFRLSVLVGQRMKIAGNGSIINISAYGALRPLPYIAPYAAAKLGLNNITLSLARELAPQVRVNAIMPGAFRTDSSHSWEPGKWESMASLGRIGSPQEIVGAVLYFAGDSASFTTGAILRVDGGIL
jgi:NAD(P)-dependent dehydrogenase (short-subunit alcohol dehydrogenase family)